MVRCAAIFANSSRNSMQAYMVLSLLFVSVGNRRLACPGCREVTRVNFPHYPQTPSTAALPFFPISILNSNIAGNNVPEIRMLRYDAWDGDYNFFNHDFNVV